ncbi:MAG TPA: tetratricopeptide repeat protein [Gammaproteobacteria bacterium]
MKAFLPLLLVVLAPAAFGLTIEYGERPEPLAECDRLAYRGERSAASTCYQRLRAGDDLAIRAEAARALGDFRGANEAFREAVRQAPDDASLRARWGYLFLETHQANEAVQLFNEALERDPKHIGAKLGLASVAAGRFEDRAHGWLEEVLSADEDNLPALLLLARMDLEEGALDRAAARLDRAERIAEEQGHPPLEVYALKAALDLLNGNANSEWVGRALAYNPTYGEVYETVAHFYVITRRYREAIDLLQKAVELKPDLYSAHAELGVNLLRENRVVEAQRHLATAYQGDPYSPQIVNTLRLIDSFENFVVSTHEPAEGQPYDPGVILRLHESEAEVLEPYVLALARKSIETFTERYDFTLKEPVVVELYPEHDDFAVRTSGLPGIGLLGVTFGHLVAMDSPSGRAEGDFHWGTTLWHEMAHVFTLEATAHLVPRWFSEGVSVYEEWSTGPLPGRHLPIVFFEAMRDDQLLPIAELDRGFIRPTYQAQVVVSYMQAGLVCEYIAMRWGQEGLKSMLAQFAEGVETGDAVERALGIPAEQFDEEFAAHLETELGAVVDNLESWQQAQREAHQQADAANWPAALEAANRAIELFPDFVDEGSAYLIKAKAHEEAGDVEQAAATLADYRRRGGHDPTGLRALAKWRYEAGDVDEAVAVLEDVLLVAPLGEDVHAELGDRLLEVGRPEQALAEYQTYAALDPHDQANVHYRLARAYQALDDQARAREHLLYALEIAPHYREAQQMLLEIVR